MLSRRRFIELTPLLLQARGLRSASAGPAHLAMALDTDWIFEGKSTVTVPHCVTHLSWQDWDPASWERTWSYRRTFTPPREFHGHRVFLQFDGVMVGAAPVINGHALPEHLGGYLPFRYEITEWVKPAENELALTVDSRWSNVPPEGSPKGPVSIDYLEPGGITRNVTLTAVPQVYISDVFAKPVKVLDADRRVEVKCTVDAASVPGEAVEVRCELMDSGRSMAGARQGVKFEKAGETEVSLTLGNVGNIALWDNDHPRLYDVVTTLLLKGKPVHDHRVRIGFREARFDVDGFFLNGKRLQIFGLNRHEIFPYVGGAMPRRVMRRDAEILRREFNCNAVRCSHYPQTEAFLDACDELGLMVWEEPPGWQYLGDDSWKELAVRDVGHMIVRDRNHPSIIIWGVRINESANNPVLYQRTRELAHSLDDSRPTSGSMTPTSSKNWQQEWHQDVFAFDDYHAAPDGTVAINEPLPGVPYMLAEAVGQFNYAKKRVFDAKYRRGADIQLQRAQAVRHAQAHDRAMAYSRCAGVIAWCAFDYGSLVNAYRAVKTPGVADVFRIPKLGASFYQSQVSPQMRPVILPNFYWDGETPGPQSVIFSNCDRLALFLDGKPLATVQPDRANYPHLRYPPFVCDLTATGADLRIDGFAADKPVLSRSFSTDKSKDQFLLASDDEELAGDGSDATRVWFHVTDHFGAPRAMAAGEVSFQLTGPGVLVGDNPFGLADSGGVGAVWVKSAPKSSGRIVVTATHSTLGKKSVEIRVRRA
ncbi:MAG TPA: glycoside hydrolase family 2 TIM barrel-domain containing protein [Bryobacteraceae bacterium]|jgi:beta-galactosidase